MRKALVLGIGVSGALLSGAAHAYESCGISYMILPDGNCVDASYITDLGSINRSTAAAERVVNRQERANRSLDANFFYRAAESDSEREQRYETLAENQAALAEIRADAASVEELLYREHMYVMSRVSQAYQPRFARN